MGRRPRQPEVSYEETCSGCGIVSYAYILRSGFARYEVTMGTEGIESPRSRTKGAMTVWGARQIMDRWVSASEEVLAACPLREP